MYTQLELHFHLESSINTTIYEESSFQHLISTNYTTIWMFLLRIEISTRGVSHRGLAIYIKKGILRQKKKKKKNYGNSNIISPCKK
jgi:hypothetical protein